MDANPRPVVVDNGSESIKSGFAGDDTPHSIIPTVLGRPQKDAHGLGEGQQQVGGMALSLRNELDLIYPIDLGRVTNWEVLEKIWDYTFTTALHIDPTQHPVLLTEAPLTKQATREMMFEILYERFCIPNVHVANQAILSLHASGRSTGVVVDIGHTVAHVVPICEGTTLPHTVRHVNIGGCDLTNYMQILLTERGYSFKSVSELGTARDIKETLCYAAQDYEDELRTAASSSRIEKSYELFQGQVYTIGRERFQCIEALFQPSLLGMMGTEGIGTATHLSIKRCNLGIRSELCKNIILAGGSSMIPALEDRLQKDVSKLVPSFLFNTVKVVAPGNRKYLAWIGGSMVASLSDTPVWISRHAYEEYGPSIVHKYSL